AIKDRDRQQIEDAEVQADKSHQSDDRLPARHGDGFTGVAGNTNGAAQLLHIRAPRDETMQYIKDVTGVVHIEADRTSDCCGERELFNTEGWQVRFKAEAIAHLACAVVRPGWLHMQRERLSIAINVQQHLLAILLLQIRHHGWDRVQRLAIDGLNDVTSL